jgi:iron-sulfur cluster assembly protein
MVALTAKAQDVVHRLVDEATTGVTGLRIMVNEGGCSGLRYVFGLEAAPNADDKVFEFGDVKVFVDPASLPIVDGLQIDFVEGLESSGFVFDNPKARDVCSCGKSFAS